MGEEESNEEIAKELAGLIGSNPYPESKHNVHSFLNNVASSANTTKTGYLTETELGLMPQTLRSCKELALISKKIMNNDFFEEYFLAEGEILTATSLSKNAKLLELAILQRREIADITKSKKKNKSWFKKKDEAEE